MKKLILILIFLIFFLIMPSTLAICCNNKDGKEGGCYPDRGICCEETNKIVGYIGCKSDLGNKCPGEVLGPCLQCSADSDCKPDGTNCNWEEIDKCSEKGLSCVIEYVSGTKIPSIISSCTDKCGEGEVMDIINKKCVKVELPTDATCTNDMCALNKYCCGTKGQKQSGQGSVCSGDYDNDGICNVYDNCPEVPNSITLGTCFPLTIKQTCTKAIPCPQGGHCSNSQDEDVNKDGIGDACQYEVSCDSSYGDRQCCDERDPTATGNGTFFGFIGHCTKESLGDVFRGVGCWSKCAIKDEQGNEITFEVGPCMDGERTVTKLQDGNPIGPPTKEPCSGIPLIPFFTSFNLIFTLLILTLFYYSREK